MKLTISYEQRMAMREHGRLGITFMLDGKKYPTFLPAYESRMKDVFYESMEAQHVYGKRMTFQNPNGSGYFTKTGPGLREQLKDGWTQDYSTLTAELLREYLFDIFFARENESDRSVKLIKSRCDL